MSETLEKSLEEIYGRLDLTNTEISVANKNKAILLQRALYTRGFLDKLNGKLDDSLYMNSDEYQVGATKASMFMKSFIKETEKLYPFVIGIDLEENFPADTFIKATETFKKSSDQCSSFIEKLQIVKPDIFDIISKECFKDLLTKQEEEKQKIDEHINEMVPLTETTTIKEK